MSSEMNQDMILKILSHSSAPVIRACRVLNKECNQKTYSSSFLQENLQRTGDVSGYFIEYGKRFKVYTGFVKDFGGGVCSEVSLDFLPPGRVKIEACDSSHGILLCVNHCPVNGGEPEYIMCKPTTKQHRLIPKPKTRYFTVALGLMVLNTNPFRYKIVRLSDLPHKENRLYNVNTTLVCEVFDSDSFVWKRLNNVELPEDEFLVTRNSQARTSYGFLHWLTTKNNVFRFSFQTESWSFFTVPENLVNANVKLTRYEGKLGMVCLKSKEEVYYHELWVLKSSTETSWVYLKDIETSGFQPILFSSNDRVILADMNRIRLYNMDNGEYEDLQIRTPNFSPYYDSILSYFPIHSDYERLEFERNINVDGSDEMRLAEDA